MKENHEIEKELEELIEELEENDKKKLQKLKNPVDIFRFLQKKIPSQYISIELHDRWANNFLRDLNKVHSEFIERIEKLEELLNIKNTEGKNNHV